MGAQPTAPYARVKIARHEGAPIDPAGSTWNAAQGCGGETMRGWIGTRLAISVTSCRVRQVLRRPKDEARLSVASIGRILTYAALVVAIVMLLGSCDYKTRREEVGASTRRTWTETDSFYQWAALTALCSLVAISLLGAVAATISPRHGGPPGSTAKAIGLATGALALFALGANIAWSYWMRVIAEQQRANYAVQIAYGLPTVTYAGALGAAVCVLLVHTLLSATWRDRTRSSPHRESSG